MDLFGAPILHDRPYHISAIGKRRYDKPRGYPHPPGTGPAGETCGTCALCAATGSRRRTYFKCRVIERHWTHGPGTDIRKKSPACSLWKPHDP